MMLRYAATHPPTMCCRRYQIVLQSGATICCYAVCCYRTSRRERHGDEVWTYCEIALAAMGP
eukprot:1276757-Rhodomonas_salina.1